MEYRSAVTGSPFPSPSCRAIVQRGSPVSGSNSSGYAANATSLRGQKNSISSCCTTAICDTPQGSLNPMMATRAPRNRRTLAVPVPHRATSPFFHDGAFFRTLHGLDAYRRSCKGEHARANLGLEAVESLAAVL
jgi:hypothetical protein